jgi:hypothetical protein
MDCLKLKSLEVPENTDEMRSNRVAAMPAAKAIWPANTT